MSVKEPAWQRINRLFARHGLAPPPTRLRDELVTYLLAHDANPVTILTTTGITRAPAPEPGADGGCMACGARTWLGEECRLLTAEGICPEMGVRPGEPVVHDTQTTTYQPARKDAFDGPQER